MNRRASCGARLRSLLALATYSRVTLRPRTGAGQLPPPVRENDGVKARVLDVLATRYASPELAAIWSPEAKVRAERRLWLAVLAAQRDLGLPVPDGAIEAYEAVLDGVPLELSRREFDLLHYLARHAGQVVPKRDLLAHVWRMPYGGADKTVDVHVSWLRRKMGETAQEPRYLYTVRGVGIKLAAPG